MVHIERVSILNTLGIEALEFQAGKFTKINGANGTGKTSVLEAIKTVVGGGTDATLLRRGQEKGEIVLVLDDGTSFTKRFTEKTTTVIVEKDGVQQAKPQQAINALRDMLSVNPIDFLRAPKKLRTDALLEALPLQSDPDKLREIVGDPAYQPRGTTALDQVQAAYDSVFSDRTGTNRAVTEKDATINQLRQTLPTATPGAPAGDLAELDRQIAEVDAWLQTEISSVDTRLADLRTASQATIAGLTQQIEDERVRIAGLGVKAADKQGRVRAEHLEKKTPIAAAAAAIRANEGAAARASQTQETIRIMEAGLVGLRADAERQTAALERLTAYKSELMASLPIDGLAVRDGEIFRHDIPFDRLNSSQQVDIAVEIAKLRAGALGIICVDGLELLDAAHFEAFQTSAIASGLQLFVTRVTDGAFAIETQN